MVESGVTEGGKNTGSFHFRGWTQQESTTQTGSLMQAKKQRFSKLSLQLLEEKDAHNTDKEKSKSFIQWF